MAFPTVSAPYGLIPINRVDGMPYAGQLRQIPIASGFNAAIGFGSVLQLTNGYVNLITSGSNPGNIVGVCVGGSYTNSSGQPVEAQYIPVGASNPVAYVIDDPMAQFKAAVVTSGTTVTTTGVTRGVVGCNMALVLNSVNTTTGNATTGIEYGTQDDASTLPVRVIDVVPQTALASGNYVELLVKINTNQYNNTTGNNAP